MTRNKPATKLDMDALAQDVHLFPDDYQWKRAKRLGVAQRTIGDGLKRLGITRQKTLEHKQIDKATRAAFQDKISTYKSEGRRTGLCG